MSAARKVQTIALLGLWSCAGAPPARGSDSLSRRLDRVRAYNELLIEVQRATAGAKAALNRRDAVETQVSRLPTAEACAALERAGAEVDAAWGRLEGAYGELASRAEPGSPPRARAEARGRITSTQRRLDVEHHRAWRARCDQLPPVAAVANVEPSPPARLCRDLWRHGDLLELVAPLAGPHPALRVARRLSLALQDELDVLLVLADVDAPEVVAIARGPERPSGAYLPEHLPRWRRLRGVALLDARPGLRAGPSLHGLVAAHAGGGPWACGPGSAGHPGGNDVPLGPETLRALGVGCAEAAQPLRVGVVVVTPQRLGEASVLRHRRDAAAFFAAGPDDDPHLLDLYEASGGGLSARLTVPTLRAHACSTVAP